MFVWVLASLHVPSRSTAMFTGYVRPGSATRRRLPSRSKEPIAYGDLVRGQRWRPGVTAASPLTEAGMRGGSLAPTASLPVTPHRPRSRGAIAGNARQAAVPGGGREAFGRPRWVA